MRKLLLLIVIFLIIKSGFSQDTFSICVVDTITGEVGSAGASCIGEPQLPGGCRILSDVHPGVGVIHAQAYYLAGNQNYARSLMNMGVPPQQIIDSLVAHDVQNNPSIRQYGVVDLFEGSARTAAYTGINCDDYKNHIIGPNYTIQGNILLGQQILDSMEARFLATNGELACRLMAALQGAKVIGADTRCLDDGVSSLSSFLRVAKPGDPINNLYLDFNVPSVPAGIDPIDSLQSLIDAWGGCTSIRVKENIVQDEINIFPNPIKNTITFSINNGVFSLADLLIFDNFGNKVYKQTGISGKVITIRLEIKPGFYYYLIRNNSQLLKGKLIVQ